MKHVFTFKDKFYVYDTGSGALHECDEQTARLLEGKPTAMTEEELKETLESLSALRKEGLLDAPEKTARPIKSHEVKALCLQVSHDCNLRCRYCFADEGAYHSVREVMSFETAKAAIDFLLRESGSRKVLEVDFFGGEPLMNLEVVKETVYYAKAEAAKLGKRFLFTTTTNGLLLDDDAIKFFNEEMENVVLSLDGRPEIHDEVIQVLRALAALAHLLINRIKMLRAAGD